MAGRVDTGVGKTPASYRELIDIKVSKLPESERDLLDYDSVNRASGLAAISGFLLNVSLKRSLLLYEGTITTGLFCSLSSLVSNYGLHKVTQDSLFSDPSSCTVCAMVRGGFAQAFSSSVFPLGVSFALGAIIGDRYGSVTPPEFRWKSRVEFWKFWAQKFKPVRIPFFVSFGLQTAFGCYYAYKRKVAIDRVHDSVTEEEVLSLMSSQLREFHKLDSYHR